MKTLKILITAMIVSCLVACNGKDSVSSVTGGTVIPLGGYEAVGQVQTAGGSCTGTLITDDIVLTAAHCVCQEQDAPIVNCVDEARFILKDVFLVDDPSTPFDESNRRTDVTLSGKVEVHPEYGVGGWLFYDYAIIRLDQPASSRIKVKPIPVESPAVKPKKGALTTLIGFGKRGDLCVTPSDGLKRKVELNIDDILPETIVFNNTTKYVCPGDSGGPALNEDNNVIGVCSSGNNGGNSNYDPTHLAYDWIFGIGQIRQAKGKLTFLRVHDLGTGYGPSTDRIDGEVVIKLDSKSNQAFGFKLRDQQEYSASTGMLELLRSCFNNDLEVTIDYAHIGPQNSEIIRIASISK